MSTTIYLSISALMYSIIIMIMFLTKKKVKKAENIIYKYLLFTSILACVFELLIPFVEFYSLMGRFVQKTFLVFIILWFSLFVVYTFTITKIKDQNNISQKYKGYLGAFALIIMSIILMVYGLPIYFYDVPPAKYTYGPSVNVVFAVVGIYMVFLFCVLVKNIKYLRQKKYLPILLTVVLFSVAVLIQKINPSWLLINCVIGLVTAIMYFTIENPDLKMLESYHDAKQYAEDLNIEKQMFIYNISQDMKIPLIKTSKYCEDLLYSDDLNTYKNGIRSIKSECNSMIQKINSIYDIDIDDIKNIDTDNTKYNLSNLLKLVTSNVKKDIEESNKKIQFITSIDDTLPQELIGDITRLKEVLNKLFKLSIKNTKEGFIEFKVQGLVKGNICRLMISLEDSGKGIETEKLEEMLSKDAKENDLGTAKKIINILGGNLIVSSNVGVGTKVNIVLDQEIPVSNKKDLDKYEDSYFDKKNILVLGGSTDERKIFMREIDEYNGVMETTESINEVIESIKKHKRYYAIIIDGDIKYHTIKEVVEKLKGIKGFNSNIIVFSKEKEMKSSKNRAIIGIQGYIARPLVEGSVLDTLKNLDK